VPTNAPGSESKRAAKRRRGRERAARRLAQRIEIVERVASGESYAAIAADLGRSESSVRERFLRTMEQTAQSTEVARQEALMRLARIQHQWWGDATSEEDTGRAFIRAHRAMKQLRWILDQKHRIEGLYEPTATRQTAVTRPPAPTDKELRDLFKKIERPVVERFGE
jgi:hypothetical protein